MNEKLTLQDLVDLLSKKAKITKKDADSFFREFFQLILERIFENDLVRIKDFGTFKLVAVSSRESVNVNTGEKIEIPSHSKLSFVPDKTLKNLVNKPFSQFETILLDDGAVVDVTIDEDDEDVSVDEFIDDVADVSNSVAAQDVEDPIKTESVVAKRGAKSEVIGKTEIEVKSEKMVKAKPSTNQIYPKSFVYTYTTSSTEQKSNSITLSVPKEDLQVIVPNSKVEDLVEKNESVVENNDFLIELKDLPIISVEDSLIEDESVDVDVVENIEDALSVEESLVADIKEESVTKDIPQAISPIEIESPDPEIAKVPEVETIISTSKTEKSLDIPLLTNVTSNDVELEFGLDSQIEMEEDIVIPIPIVDIVQPKPQSEESSRKRLAEKEKKVKFSDEDPERPLFPNEDDDIAEDLSFSPIDHVAVAVEEEIELDQDDEGTSEPVISNRYAGNNKPTEIRRVSFSETMDAVDISYPDYSNTGTRSKIKKWLPIILFVLVIVGFLTYGLVKMLQKPYDYEYYLGSADASADTVSVDDVAKQVSETDALLDSMKRVQESINKDTIKTVSNDPATISGSKLSEKQDADLMKNSLVGTADSLTTDLINAEKNGLIISKNLKFGILHKAEYHLLKFPSTGQSVSTLASLQTQEDGTVASKSGSATIKRGTTLRTIATTYYGNPTYWVYIYQANKRKIANPNSVPIGTQLLIPLLSDYGVTNPKDPKAIQVAKKLESKILRGG